eukprot:gene50179-41987_t
MRHPAPRRGQPSPTAPERSLGLVLGVSLDWEVVYKIVSEHNQKGNAGRTYYSCGACGNYDRSCSRSRGARR